MLRSGAIFGILKQMKETFESNLSNSQKEEMQSQTAYDDLKSAKETEIKAGEDQSDTKTQELADTDEKLAQAKQVQLMPYLSKSKICRSSAPEFLARKTVLKARSSICLAKYRSDNVLKRGPRRHPQLPGGGPEVLDELEGDAPDDRR